MAVQVRQPGLVGQGEEATSRLVQAPGGRDLVAAAPLQRGQGQQRPGPGPEHPRDGRQVAPLPQHPPRSFMLAGVGQDQAEVEQGTPASGPVLHIVEEQQRLAEQPVGPSQVSGGGGDQALADDGDADPAPVAQAAADRHAALE